MSYNKTSDNRTEDLFGAQNFLHIYNFVFDNTKILNSKSRIPQENQGIRISW